MPNELRVFSCKFCGFESTNRNECVNCEGSHLHTKDIAVDRIERPSDSELCYDAQSVWPTFIHVKCATKSIDGMVYQLVRAARPRKATR